MVSDRVNFIVSFFSMAAGFLITPLDSTWVGLKSYSPTLNRHAGGSTVTPISSFPENQSQVFRLLVIAQEKSPNGRRKKSSQKVQGSNPRKPLQARQYVSEAVVDDFLKRKGFPDDDDEEPKVTEIVDGGSDSKKEEKFPIEERKVLWKRFQLPSRKVTGIVVLNILTVIYASNIPIIKETEAILDPSLFSVVRFSVATIPFIPFMFQTKEDAKIRTAGVELGLWVGAAYLMQGIGLLTTDAGHASFISAFTVIVVPLLDGLFGTRISKITWFGATMALIGIGLLEYSGSSITVGDFWSLLSAILFGIHMLRTEHFSRAIKKDKFLGLLGYEIVVIALLSAIWYWWSSDTFSLPHMNFNDINWTESWKKLVALPWFPIIYTGIFSTGFCLWAELAAMQDVSATEAAIIYGLEPLWGAAFAWFLLGERWGPTGWLGAVLILGGSFTVQLFGSSIKKP